MLPTTYSYNIIDNPYATNHVQIDGHWVVNAKESMHSTQHDEHDAVGRLTYPVC